jgi:hypothetical protein
MRLLADGKYESDELSLSQPKKQHREIRDPGPSKGKVRSRQLGKKKNKAMTSTHCCPWAGGPAMTQRLPVRIVTRLLLLDDQQFQSK